MRIVSTLSQGLDKPVTCKIRLLPSFEETLSLCHALVAAGCSLLTVHGRTKEQNKHLVGTCDWEAIRRIKERMPIPVFANGGISDLDDVLKCMEATGVDGVMSSEALLENPGLFSRNIRRVCSGAGAVEGGREGGVNQEEVEAEKEEGGKEGDDLQQQEERLRRSNQLDLAEEYLEIVDQYPPERLKCVRAHVFKMVFTGVQLYEDLRDKLVVAATVEDMKDVVREIRKRAEEEGREGGVGARSWYWRHWTEGEKGGEGGEGGREEGVEEVVVEEVEGVGEEGYDGMGCLFGGEEGE